MPFNTRLAFSLLKGIPPQKLAGMMLFIGNTVFVLGLVVAESVFPGYSVSRDFISDLGAPIAVPLNPPGILTIHQPASIIYILSLSILTVLSLEATWQFRKTFPSKRFWKIFLVFAAGLVALPLSYIPYYFYAGQQVAQPISNVPAPLIVGAIVHDALSGLVFFFGGLSAIESRKLVANPLDKLFPIVGAIAIGAAALSGVGVDLGLGPGGIERIVAYPILVWALAFGGYLVGANSGVAPPPSTSHSISQDSGK